MVRIIWIIIFIWIGFVPAISADIRIFENASGNKIDVVEIRGEISRGDYITFIGILKPNHKMLVILSSPGGLIQDALNIGMEIRLRGYSTSVVRSEECFSACALIWLAGTHRLMSVHSKIGFHAAYIVTNGIAAETGAANAEVGSYLTRLGFNIDAIRYFTNAPPDSLQYLDFETAATLDIDVSDSASLPTIPSEISNAPSFDCARAATEDEIAVCSNSELAERDRAVAQLYGSKLKLGTPSITNAIKIEQREWLALRRSCRADIACLKSVYDLRVKSLSTDAATEQPLPNTPSFDCNKAVAEDEIAICHDSELTKKDFAMAQLYGSKLKLGTPGITSAIKIEQRNWLALRHACKANVECLKNIYDLRLESLSR